MCNSYEYIPPSTKLKKLNCDTNLYVSSERLDKIYDFQY